MTWKYQCLFFRYNRLRDDQLKDRHISPMDFERIKIERKKSLLTLVLFLLSNGIYKAWNVSPEDRVSGSFRSPPCLTGFVTSPASFSHTLIESWFFIRSLSDGL